MADYSTSDVPEIFVAYAREDQARVEKIVRILKDRGFLVFWDLDIRTGEDWYCTLLEKLDEVQCVLVIWSKCSAKSKAVRDEANEAMEIGKYFPVVLDDLKKPPLYYRSQQYLNLGGPANNSRSADLEKLCLELHQFIEKQNSNSGANKENSESQKEELLVQTVNRDKQLELIQDRLNEAKNVSMFLYYGRSRDWPGALGNHLQYFLTEDSEVYSLTPEKNVQYGAFKEAFIKTVCKDKNSDEHNMLNWFRSGCRLKILLCHLFPDGRHSAFLRQVREAVEFITEVESQVTESRLIVLFACNSKRAPAKIIKWWLFRAYSNRKGVSFFILDNLTPITEEHTHEWVEQLAIKYVNCYRYENIKCGLSNYFNNKTEEHYLRLKQVLEDLLYENRC